MKPTKFVLFALFVVLLSSVCNKSRTGTTGGDRLPQWAVYGGNVRHTGKINTPAYDGIVGLTDSTTVLNCYENSHK